MYDQDVRILKDTISQILKNRSFLKWSYPFIYYTYSDESLDNQKHLFEVQQSLLEMSTENLQELIQIKLETV